MVWVGTYGGVDGISNDLEAQWRPDIENLVELGVNVLRIYHVISEND